MSAKTSNEEPLTSPLWHRALQRYRKELDQNDDYQSVTEIASLTDLLNHTKTIENRLPRDRVAIGSLQRLGPTLKFVDDFSAVIAVCFGADAKLTAFVWGSIRLMLTLASAAGDTLKDVIDMLEELSLTLPRLRTYETSFEMERGLEAALVDVYTEVICFYARCIHFFRSHPSVLLRRGAWEDFRDDFARTLRRVRRLSATVESEADFARMERDRGKYDEVLGLMEKLKETKLQEHEQKRYHYIPSTLSPRFWGREDALDAVEESLSPKQKSHQLKTFALYGMGGVGKTQIALQYAKRHRESFSIILWVAADNVINMGQSFREIAKLLGLSHTEQELQDTQGCMLKVKSWLTEASDPWILIFNNADNLEVLRHAWPTNGEGSVLITTRDANAVHSPATKGFHVQPFDATDGSDLLLNLLGLDHTSLLNREKSVEITKALGGLPLALTQIGGFIVQRKLALRDFLPLYERNASKIDARQTSITGYEHTLSTVWEMSMSRLEGDTQTLFNMLPYFQPDGVDETILSQGSVSLDDPAYGFLHDEMDLGDAEEVLLRTGLVDKNAEDAVLSIHRLIQAAILRNQSPEIRKNIFHIVVCILSWAFPDTWSEDVGHQFQSWANCEKCLPHVNHLVAQREKHKIGLTSPQSYGELLLRCSWYLYERECYDIAKTLIIAALETFEEKSTLSYASAIDLSGLLDLDMNNAKGALRPFEEAFAIRKQLLGPTDGMIASSLNNIALAYTEMDELDKAYSAHKEAIGIRLSTNSDRIGNSYSNMSSLLLKMKRPEEAEEMLKRCPSLKDFTDETFIKTGNPRFSGDMVLLSRIRIQQGRLDEALRLASKALVFRQTLLGNRLKTCDSLYDVASLLHMHGNTASAIELLDQLTNTAGSIPEGKGQLARAYFKLAVLQEERGRLGESHTYKEMAEGLRAELNPESAEAPFIEEEFMKLCVWMLW
ncbi:TPR-like protein [Dothidotthia symphoricarpi CBS 119687]|uniref:TPR-like protein n=1 Tax=Dothidotthia symphoricarpi CBS 119687 TaxID=1392245 RepID=A0A6A5ZX47_9PLEO|nr:TPR-like protein [Dothidotthia symphoricarpi CBS 119687]KAF2124109.1 TPR-like protein [Dothidotthia symphoricarpi CBS 119687]